jgi:hypothetical protein
MCLRGHLPLDLGPNWAIQNDPYLKILNSIISAKTLLPNKVTFTGSKGSKVDIYFGGGIPFNSL